MLTRTPADAEALPMKIKIAEHDVLVDERDAGLMASFRWYVERRNRTYYAMAKIGRKIVRLHRLIVHCQAGYVIDHINGNGLDNRRCNLRVALHQQNVWNAPKYRVGSNTFKGCHRFRGKWRALIRVDAKQRFLGTFETEIEAAKAYDAAARRYFGEYARPNFPS